jgi:hypothetical protein
MVEHFLLGIFSFMLIWARDNIIGIDLVGLLCGSAAGTIGLCNQCSIIRVQDRVPKNLSRMNGMQFDKGFMKVAMKRTGNAKHTNNKNPFFTLILHIKRVRNFSFLLLDMTRQGASHCVLGTRSQNQIDHHYLLSLKFANESSDPTMTVNLTDCSGS